MFKTNKSVQDLFGFLMIVISITGLASPLFRGEAQLLVRSIFLAAFLVGLTAIGICLCKVVRVNL
jgi:hypothetical protein